VQAVTATGLPVTIAKAGGDLIDARSILMVMGLATSATRPTDVDDAHLKVPRPAY